MKKKIPKSKQRIDKGVRELSLSIENFLKKIINKERYEYCLFCLSNHLNILLRRLICYQIAHLHLLSPLREILDLPISGIGNDVARK